MICCDWTAALAAFHMCVVCCCARSSPCAQGGGGGATDDAHTVGMGGGHWQLAEMHAIASSPRALFRHVTLLGDTSGARNCHAPCPVCGTPPATGVQSLMVAGAKWWVARVVRYGNAYKWCTWERGVSRALRSRARQGPTHGQRHDAWHELHVSLKGWAGVCSA